jgi:hypothetical protein
MTTREQVLDQPQYLPHSGFGDPSSLGVPEDDQEHGFMLL